MLYEGEIREAADVLAELGLEPLEFEAKEGLAMTNGTSFMSGFATLAVHDARELAFVADALHVDGTAGADGQPRTRSTRSCSRPSRTRGSSRAPPTCGC